MTPPPLARKTAEGEIDPFDKNFSAFVFKIQANMNKAHRDRLTFMRICSGKFDREMEVYHVQSGKKMRLSQPHELMAQDREIISEAYARGHYRSFLTRGYSLSGIQCAQWERN